MLGIARIAQAAHRRAPPARRSRYGAEARRHVAGKLLHPLVRRVAVRVEVDVGQPLRQTRLRTSASGSSGSAMPDLRADVHAERAVAPRVQHVRRRELLQLVRHRRAVRVLDRVQHHVDLLEDRLVRGIGQQQLRQPQDVARRRHLVRVLPAGDEDRRLRRWSAWRATRARCRRAGVISSTEIVAAAIRAARLVGRDLGKARQLAARSSSLSSGLIDVIPRHSRRRRPSQRRVHVPSARSPRCCGRRRRALRLLRAPTASATPATCSYDSAACRRRHAAGAPGRRARRAARAASRSSFASTRSSSSRTRSPSTTARCTSGRRDVDLRDVARDLRRLLGPSSLYEISNLGLVEALPAYRKRTVPGWPRRSGWMIGKILPGAARRRATVRPADRVEEVERHEVEVLVQRLERRHELLVDANAEVGLAHRDVDVEVAVKRLLVGHRRLSVTFITWSYILGSTDDW